MVELAPHTPQCLPPPPLPLLVTSCDPLPCTNTRGLSCPPAHTAPAITHTMTANPSLFMSPPRREFPRIPSEGQMTEVFPLSPPPRARRVAHSSPGPQTARFSPAGVEARFWLEWGTFISNVHPSHETVTIALVLLALCRQG